MEKATERRVKGGGKEGNDKKRGNDEQAKGEKIGRNGR